MKIKSLKTRAFRSVQDSTLEFGDNLTILAGPQGSGKSTHLHAACAVLTGRTPHTDRRGVGIKEQIRRDQPRAEFEMTCSFNGTGETSVIRRTVAESGQTLEVPFGGKNLSAKQALLTDKMGGVDEVPDVLLDPRLFAERAPDEQRQALLKLLRPPVIEVPKEAKAVGVQSLISIQQVDDQIKSMKDGTVRSLNAVIKNLKKTLPAEPTAEELATAKTAQLELAVLAEQIQSLALKSREAQLLLDDARKHEGEIAQSRILAAKVPDLRQSLDAARDQLQCCARNYKASQEEHAERKGFVRDSANKIAALQQDIDKIQSVDGECPTCTRKLSPKAKAELIKVLEIECSSEKDDLEALTERMEAAAKQLAEDSAKGSEARSTVERLSAELLEAEHAQRFVATYQPRNIDELAAALDKSVVDLEEAQSQKEFKAMADEAGRLTLQRHEEHQRITRDLVSNRARREQYLMAVESLQTLKDSILGGESAKRLQDDTTEIFQKFFPHAHVILSPEGASVAPIGSQDGTPVEHLSSGQKVIFDMGLRIAAARATGFGILAVDDANKLAPSAREVMLKILQSCGCQVIMCTTSDKIGPIPNTVVYRMENPGVWGPSTATKVK